MTRGYYLLVTSDRTGCDEEGNYTLLVVLNGAGRDEGGNTLLVELNKAGGNEEGYYPPRRRAVVSIGSVVSKYDRK